MELIFNWAQTGYYQLQPGRWHQRARREWKLKVFGDKRQFTAVFCASLVG